ncbi:hypothetical protein AAEX28_15815 [Lentisphaerota bacterium WC36G]|nr:hypothetical protein LJT99_02575 [Lentisphaerae bacterium WC36]
MKNNENGFVLITVMMTVMLLSVIILGLISVTKITSKEVMTNNMLSRSAYEIESVANRVNFTIRSELKNCNNSSNQNSNFNNQVNVNPNAIISQKNNEINVNGEIFCYKVIDATGGLDFSRNTPGKALNILTKFHHKNKQENQESAKILAIVKDYTDLDDYVSINGAEHAKYAAIELNLPRNSRMIFRSEVLFIPQLRQYFEADNDGRLTMVKMISPKGMRGVSSKRNIANASSSELQYLSGFSQNRSVGILRKIQENQSNNFNSFSGAFTPDVAGKLSSNFTTKPSEIFTIKIWKKVTNDLSVSRTYFVTESLKSNDLKNAAKLKKRQLYEVLNF